MKVKCIFRKSSAHTTHPCNFGFWNSICRRFNIKTGLHSHLFRIKPHVQALVARNDHHPLFFKLSVNVFIFNKISLLSHLFFLNLTCIIALFFKSDMYTFEMLRIWTTFITRKLLYQEFPIGWAEIFRSPPWLNWLFINLLLMIQCYIPWEGEGGYDENLK